MKPMSALGRFVRWFRRPRCWPLLGETLLLLARACLLRRGRRARPRLPPVAASARPAAREILELAERVNRITRPFAGRSRHACWYRAYPLAAILRRRGLDARLNIGLACPAPRSGPAWGHAWLTLDGALFNEPDAASSAARSFPHLLADDGRGLRYWVAAGRDGLHAGKKAGG